MSRQYLVSYMAVNVLDYHLQTVLKMEVAGSSETLVNCLLEHMVSYKVCLKSNENGAIKFFIKN